MASWLDSLFAGGGAPADATYLTVAHDASLSGERVIAVAAGQLAKSDGGANASLTLGLDTTAVTPGAYTNASVTVDAYGRVTAAASGTSAYGWTAIDTALFTHTASRSDTLTVDSAVAEDIALGHPIKWMASDTFGTLPIAEEEVTAFAPTGLTSAHCDVVGCITVLCVEIATPDFRLELYSDPAMQASQLIGHTATFDSTTAAAQAIIADNASGLGGTISNGAGTLANGEVVYLVAQWAAIVTGITRGATTTLTIAGAPLSTAADAILEVWRGEPSLVHEFDMPVIAGAWAGATTTTLLVDFDQPPVRNRGPWCQIVEWSVYVPTFVAGAKINLLVNGDRFSTLDADNGLAVAAADTWYTTLVDVRLTAVSWIPGNDRLELEVTSTGNVTGLHCHVVTVRM